MCERKDTEWETLGEFSFHSIHILHFPIYDTELCICICIYVSIKGKEINDMKPHSTQIEIHKQHWKFNYQPQLEINVSGKIDLKIENTWEM